MPTRISETKILHACRVGNLRQLQRWFDAQTLPLSDLLQKYPNPYSHAIDTNNLELFQWLCQTSAAEDLALHASALVWNATNSGRANFLQWMLEARIFTPKQLQAYIRSRLRSTTDLLPRLAEAGYFELLRWLFEHIPSTLLPARDQAIVAAAANGHLDVLKFLIDDHGQQPTQSRTSTESFDKTLRTAFESSAANGHLEIVRYLLQTYETLQTHQHTLTSALWAAACNGHLPILEELLQLNEVAPANVTINMISPVYLSLSNLHSPVSLRQRTSDELKGLAALCYGIDGSNMLKAALLQQLILEEPYHAVLNKLAIPVFFIYRRQYLDNTAFRKAVDMHLISEPSQLQVFNKPTQHAGRHPQL